MAVRQAKSGDLSKLVRERQDLVGEWQVLDKTLIATRAAPPEKRNTTTEAAFSARFVAMDERIGEIDGTLKNKFPDYAAIASPEPMSVSEVQTWLRADEALILFLDTPDWWRPIPEETFIWVVTKTNMRWVTSELGTKEH